jgi:hypothetical protein
MRLSLEYGTPGGQGTTRFSSLLFSVLIPDEESFAPDGCCPQRANCTSWTRRAQRIGLLTSSLRVRRIPCESASIPQHPFPTTLPAALCPPTCVGVRARSTETARIFARYDCCVYAMPINIRKIYDQIRGGQSCTARQPFMGSSGG